MSDLPIPIDENFSSVVLGDAAEGFSYQNLNKVCPDFITLYFIF
jgi:hypothetical protein